MLSGAQALRATLVAFMGLGFVLATAPGAEVQPIKRFKARPVAGFEVVPSGVATVAPLSVATVEASCSPGKVAIGAGYRAAPANATQTLAARGLEIRQAMPDGPLARVTLRNANVFEAGTIQAFAICIAPIAGLRVATNPARSFNPAPCNDDERVIGGGFSGIGDGAWLNGFGPVADGRQGGSWDTRVVFNSFARQQPPRIVAMCAPRLSVAGWSLQESTVLMLGSQSSGTTTARCVSGTAIGAGIDGFLSTTAQVFPSLAPSGDGWEGFVYNTSLSGPSDGVKARVRAICALTSP